MKINSEINRKFRVWLFLLNFQNYCKEIIFSQEHSKASKNIAEIPIMRTLSARCFVAFRDFQPPPLDTLLSFCVSFPSHFMNENSWKTLSLEFRPEASTWLAQVASRTSNALPHVYKLSSGSTFRLSVSTAVNREESLRSLRCGKVEFLMTQKSGEQ